MNFAMNFTRSLIAIAAFALSTSGLIQSAQAQSLPSVRRELFVYRKAPQGIPTAFKRSAPFRVGAAESRLVMESFEIKADIAPSCDEEQVFCYRHQLAARLSKSDSATQIVYPLNGNADGTLSASLVVGREEAALNCTVEN